MFCAMRKPILGIRGRTYISNLDVLAAQAGLEQKQPVGLPQVKMGLAMDIAGSLRTAHPEIHRAPGPGLLPQIHNGRRKSRDQCRPEYPADGRR